MLSFVLVLIVLNGFTWCHYDDVIMTTIASQITSLTVVYSTVYSDADQSKHQSSASLAFVWGIHRDRWIPRTKGQLRGKCFHLMTSSWFCQYSSGLRHRRRPCHIVSESALKYMGKFDRYVVTHTNQQTHTLVYTNRMYTSQEYMHWRCVTV